MKELQEFKQELIHNELSKATISRYMTDINQFIDKAAISSKDDINKSKLLEYKDYLINNFKPASCNIKLIAINKFLDFIGLDNLKVKLPKKQKKNYG